MFRKKPAIQRTEEIEKEDCMGKIVKDILALIEPELDAAMEKELEAIKALASIDCGTGNLEGNAKVVEIIDALLGEIPGIAIRHIQTSLGTMVVCSTATWIRCSIRATWPSTPSTSRATSATVSAPSTARAAWWWRSPL